MTRHALPAPRAARALAKQAPDLLARHAAATASPVTLAALAHAARTAPPTRALDSIVALARAHRVLGLGLTPEGDAGRLFREAAERMDGDRASRRHRDRVIEGLISTRQIALARELDERVPGTTERAHLFQQDIANPFLEGGTSRADGAVDRWLHIAGERHRADGIEPLTLAETGATVFDRLGATTSARVDAGPLVSVVMTTYRPDHMAETAVRSMIAQTWQNWELVIVDDASPAEFHDHLQALAGLDERIRLIRAHDNAGVHRRRADGWREARGDYLTAQDSDDWVHPRRLERQLQHLIEESPIPVTMLHTSRMTEQGGWVHPGGAWRQPMHSSLLMHRSVWEAVGTLADERRSADAEYRRRIEAAYEQQIPAEPSRAPLTHIRRHDESESALAFSMMRMHPGYRAYRSAFTAWHGERRGDHGALRYDPRQDAPRFPVPAIVRAEAPPQHELDVLYVLDPRACDRAAPLHRAIVLELAALADRGLRVGLLAMLSPHLAHAHEPSPAPLQALITTGRVAEVVLDEAVTVDLLVVRHPEALLGAAPRNPSVRARRVELVRTDRAARLLPRSTVTRMVRRAALASIVHPGHRLRRPRAARLLGS
ncbi:MAG: glycosyltransferase family 2 protein [Microcella sp.]|uniref:glycosyltransferase family 2 protein n=1 Tax=Microcella sp. TaxID=1913979 RepID=UPI0033157C8D